MANERNRRPEELSREALERATSEREPDIGALLESVPDLMAEAGRRRETRRRRDSVSAVVPLAWKAIPRLAATAALLVVVAVALVLVNGDKAGGTDETESLEGWVLGVGNDETGTDLLFEIVGLENDDG